MDSLSVLPCSHASHLSPDEEKLLARLEEQNRLLETDSKSLYSVIGALRSPCSLSLFTFEEDSLSVWGCIVRNWEEWSKRKVKQLKVMIRKGIHPHFRATMWQLLCNAKSMSITETYRDLLSKTCSCEKQIQQDLTRISTLYTLFQDQDNSTKEQLFNILKAYSVLDPEVGYNQGNAFIVRLLLMQMPEEEAFSVFLRLMQDFRLRDLYKPHMIELGCCVYQLEGLIQEQLPELHSHFHTHAFNTSTFSSSWFLTIFLSCLPLNAANRVFDIFMCEGLDIVFRVGMTLLQLTEAKLMTLDLEGMAQFLEKDAPQKMETNPDKMITTAYQIKFDPKKMKKLEKEYTAFKIKELEKQEEIKRLHSENNALRQRIDTLEKRYSEDLVWEMGQALTQSRLKDVKYQHVLKQMEIKILLLERGRTVPDENSAKDLHDELVSARLNEAEALNELGDLRRQIQDLGEKWKKEQNGGSTLKDLQGELMSIRLRETHTQALLRQSKQKLLQLQTKNQIRAYQLQCVTDRVLSQRERLQELTAQNCGLRSLLCQSTKEDKHKNLEYPREDEGNPMSTITDLHEQIAQLQGQIQILSEKKEAASQSTLRPCASDHTMLQS